MCRSRLCASYLAEHRDLLTGGIISDQVAKRYGMRGRLWWLWGCQTTAGVLCVGLGLANNSFAHTLVVLCFFSFFVEVMGRAFRYETSHGAS